MSIFKKAYVRGITETLIKSGHAKFASVDDAEKVADAIGEELDFEPATDTIDLSKLAEVAEAVILVSRKLAEDTGNLITGDKGEQKNTPENAASQVGGLAALDQKNRPQGTYLVGVGNTAMRAPAAAIIGEEMVHPKAPGNTDSKPNSLMEFGKGASDLSSLLRKIAEGTGNLVAGDKPSQENTAQNAASEVGGLAALDQKNRPQGTYNKGEAGAGETALKATGSGVIGHEETHPKAPGTTDAGSNSANETSKSSSYVSRFEQTAREYINRLPTKLADNEKIAAIKTLMGLPPEEADHFLAKLGSDNGIAALVHEKDEEKHMDEKYKHEEDKDDKEDKEDKEGEKEEHASGANFDKEKDVEEKSKEASSRSRHVDPYGYKGYDAYGKNQRNGVTKQANDLLGRLRGLAR